MVRGGVRHQIHMSWCSSVASPPHLATKPNQTQLNQTQLNSTKSKPQPNPILNKIKTSTNSKPQPHPNFNQIQTSTNPNLNQIQI